MTHVDTLVLFDHMAEEMNAHPALFEALGDLHLDLVCVIHGPGGSDRIRLTFEGIRCVGVVPVKESDEWEADCRLEGDVAAWAGMFADIRDHGGADGLHTLNSLTLLGDRIRLTGSDPMGVDKFHRYNQTLQEFFDGAARVPVEA